MTTPAGFVELAALLRDQAPKRNAKRQPELVDIPGPALIKVAAAIEQYAAAIGEPVVAPAVPRQREAENMQPITGSPSLAEAESVAAAQDDIDLTKYGFRKPHPVPPCLIDELETEWLEGHYAPAVEQPAPTSVTAAGPATVTFIEPDLDAPDWLRAPTVALLPDEPAAGGHYAAGLSPSEYPGKAEAGDEPAYRLRRSVTQLTSYSECGLRYRLRYVDRIPETPAWWNLGGRAFHEVAREFETARAVHDDLMSADQAAKQFGMIFDRMIEEQLAATPDAASTTWRAANKGKETGQWWFDNGPEMAAAYVSHALRSGDRPLMLGADSPALELALVADVGGVRTIGYLDHVAVNHAERTIKIKDYKTGSRLPTDPAQLLTYGTLIATLPADLLPAGYRVTGEYWAARKATVAGTRALTGPAVDANAERFAEFDRAERAGVYLPSPSSFCGGCPVRSHCPTMASSNASTTVTDEDAARLRLD